LANCEGKFRITKHFVNTIAVTSNAPEFEPGKTYYVIGSYLIYDIKQKLVCN